MDNLALSFYESVYIMNAKIWKAYLAMLLILDWSYILTLVKLHTYLQ